MKIKPILADMSGKLAGLVASHNRGGQYFRQRTIPTTPPTSAQTAMRVFLTNSTNRWTQTLTEAERQAWNEYAVANPQVDGFGSSVNIGGLGWFNKVNSARQQAGLSFVDTAPTVNGPADLTPPEFAVDGTDLEVTFTNTDTWATAAGGALLIYMSAAQSITRFSAAGISKRYTGAILGAGTPPTSPATLTPVFPLTADMRIFLRAVAVEASGRRSAPYETFLNT